MFKYVRLIKAIRKGVVSFRPDTSNNGAWILYTNISDKKVIKTLRKDLTK